MQQARAPGPDGGPRQGRLGAPQGGAAQHLQPLRCRCQGRPRNGGRGAALVQVGAGGGGPDVV